MDELAQVLAAPVRAQSELAEVGFHQGVIIAWNSETGQNTVSTQGAFLTNVSMLNIGDTTNLARGDVVLIFRLRTQYFIVGRVVVPNTELFASSSVDFEAVNVAAGSFALTTVETIVVTTTLNVPPWANQALIHASGHFTGINVTGAEDYIYGSVWIDAAGGGQMLNEVDNGASGYVGASHARENTVTPGGIITITGRSKTAFAGWAANILNTAQLSVSCVFRKTG
jgi:hypothetical protein